MTGGIFFFGMAGISNLVFLLCAITITFISVMLHSRFEKKFILGTGIISIFTLLILVKYLSMPIKISHVQSESTFLMGAIPLGISFYSLQAISLLADKAKNTMKEKIALTDICLFLGFFPQSVAGPLHRMNDLLPQFHNPAKFHLTNLIIGFKICLFGYFLKLIVADKIHLITSPIFSDHQSFNSLTLVFSSILFTFELYFDFWGYSLIAIGVGRILGFAINANFNNPYAVASFREFWHRWHITLSKWLKDYIYIPLGGRNQNNYLLFAGTIITTFLTSGFWHGFSINFLIWSTIHAFLYLGEDLWHRLRKNRKGKVIHRSSKLIRLTKWILFIIILSLTWIVFRIEDTDILISYFNSIFTLSNWSLSIFWHELSSKVNLFYLAILITTLLVCHRKFLLKLIYEIPTKDNEIIGTSIYYFSMIIMILIFGDIGGQEFIYFNY
ncbi:MBOAT family protein [Cytophaga sp. FL35]|uniref:MBOAT family O-acyltransferase n=1 Tax=Cytophaga sp. FL35 TaxID=1904456 RepID=UPI001653BAD4|nr:MBOAT family protein [Cytophaga sp. FL35]MBC7000604.1 MBOAT family protein [Cytophaga sp. FL35]